ncbi:MAG TPA: tryptophan--tRNA ligase [Gemmatimonadales bacterium]|nr:tryptophan--tRNA ligase [Gemmatimonadales bacterium]
METSRSPVFERTNRKRVFSGIQPTGKPHIGNYLGALRLWVGAQEVHDCSFAVVDLHALTVPGAVRPAELPVKVREAAAIVLAAGVDPSRATLFVQSEVPAHAELTWLLSCVTPVGWLERMTQYKTKAAVQERASAGLLAYPVLQAADILLYRTDLVPVGEDQKQHVELARDVAQRFNRLFGEAFVVPEPWIGSGTARIMGLDDPTAKMSKSVGETRPGHAIGLTDPPEVIRRAIQGAVTDSAPAVDVATAGAGVRNLLAIYAGVTGEATEAIAARFNGRRYGELKVAVADAVIASLEPLQRRFRDLMADPGELDRVLAAGAERSRGVAAVTLQRASALIGLVRR